MKTMHKEIYVKRHKRHKRQRKVKSLFTVIAFLLLTSMLMGAAVEGIEKEYQWNDENYMTMERYGNNNN